MLMILSPGEILEFPIDNDRLVFLEVEEFFPERQKTLKKQKRYYRNIKIPKSSR